MLEHFKQIEFLYGNANVYIPKSIFRVLSSSIKAKNGDVNVKQTSFAYSYLVAITFLYKYTIYIDISMGTYVQNNNIKEFLGYSSSTKSVDKIIKKNGILDSLGLTKTIKNYPIFVESGLEEINGMAVKEYTCIEDLEDKSQYKTVVKNRNYEVKEPLFLTTSYDDNEYGTLYSVKNTHCITLQEYLYFMIDKSLDNIDFMLYAFFKAKCKGYKNDETEIALYKILIELGLCAETFFSRLEKLEVLGFVEAEHRKWYTPRDETEFKARPNKYKFVGIDKKVSFQS